MPYIVQRAVDCGHQHQGDYYKQDDARCRELRCLNRKIDQVIPNRLTETRNEITENKLLNDLT